MNLRDEMLRIRAEHGELTPSTVVADATPEGSPLHNHFDWDDSIAGPKWRRHQAHELIRSVRVVWRESTEDGPGDDIRAFQAVRDDQGGGYVYEPSDVVANDPVLTELVMREMRRDWHTMKRRYGQFAEFAEMVRESIQQAS